MRLSSFLISLDNSSGTYVSHANPVPVTGRVIIVLAESKQIEGLVLHFKGSAKVLWTEQRSRYRVYTYTSVDRFFRKTVRLLGSENDEKMTLASGEHSYPFSFLLPPHMPSSISENYGKIKFKLEAVVARPWKTGFKTIRILRVYAPHDLSLYPAEILEPGSKTAEKTFGIFGRSGPLTLTVSVPSRGIVIGQQFLVTVQLENHSNVTVRAVVGTITQYTIFRCVQSAAKFKQIKKEMCSFKFDSISPTKSSRSTVMLPELNDRPINVVTCKNINIVYLLSVKAVTSGVHHNVKVHIGVKFGSRPVDSSSVTRGGGARFLADRDLPPSYEAVMCDGLSTKL